MSESLQQRYFGHDQVTVIVPARGWRMLDLRELWAYRELLLVLAARDVKVRYKQTVLGIAWAAIQPVMAMIVFSVVFGKLAKMPTDGQPYPIFVYSALLPWTFFSGAVTTSGNSLVGSSQLISKVYFPRLIVPLASVGAGMVDFAVSSLILLLMMLYYGVAWSLTLTVIPCLLAGVFLTALGAGTLLSALTVRYRDFRYVVPFLVQLWMYATPVVYPASLVPERWRWALYLNPMAGFIDAFRASFLGTPFDWQSLLVSGAIAILLFLAGVAYFERVEREFADVI